MYGPLGLGLANERGAGLGKNRAPWLWLVEMKKVTYLFGPNLALVIIITMVLSSRTSYSMLRTSAHSASLRVHKCTCSSLRSYLIGLILLRFAAHIYSSLKLIVYCLPTMCAPSSLLIVCLHSSLCSSLRNIYRCAQYVLLCRCAPNCNVCSSLCSSHTILFVWSCFALHVYCYRTRSAPTRTKCSH
jgi:hypothetical protein